MASLPLLAAVDWNGIVVPALLRWAHVISGITWIGILYFFNFVNVPLQGKLDAPTKKIVNPELLPRALWWFRWGAMSTFVFGLLLFWVKYMPGGTPGGNFYGPEHHVTDRAMWIMSGMTLGTIMWFNVWFVIWPAQKVLIRATKAGEKPPAGLPERAKLFSRINTVLSGPMLGGMISANNAVGWDWQTIVTVLVVSLLVIHLALRFSAKVGQTV